MLRHRMILRLLPSPSMRREWIEMTLVNNNERMTHVSLHAEGVD